MKRYYDSRGDFADNVRHEGARFSLAERTRSNQAKQRNGEATESTQLIDLVCRARISLSEMLSTPGIVKVTASKSIYEKQSWSEKMIKKETV